MYAWLCQTCLMTLLWRLFKHLNPVLVVCTPEVGNLRPWGHMWPEYLLNTARPHNYSSKSQMKSVVIVIG